MSGFNPPPVPVNIALTDHQVATIVVNAVFPAVAAIFIGLRLYAKRVKHASLQADDWLILLGLVFALGNSMPLIFCAVKGGIGEHIDDITQDQELNFGKVTFWTQFPYLFAVATVKVSILIFYRGVFSTPAFKMATNFMFVLLAAWTVAFFFATLFQAWPIYYNWDARWGGTTINEVAMYNGLASTELITDVMILVMPLFVIWKLQLRASKKWAISGIFLLGSFVCVASAFRIYYLTMNATATIGSDVTYDTYNYFIWTAIEPCTGIMCACLPCLGPLFKDGHGAKSLLASCRSFLRIGSSTGGSKDSYGGNWNSKKHMMSPKAAKVSTRDDDGIPLVCEKCGNCVSNQDNASRKGSVAKPGIHVNTTITSLEERRSRGW